MSKPRILAIDPGTTFMGAYTGHFTGQSDNKTYQFYSETLAFDPKKKRPERLSEAANALANLCFNVRPDFVVYEMMFSRGDAATRALYGLCGIIESMAISHGAGVIALPQATLAKWERSVLELPKGKVNRKTQHQLVADHFGADTNNMSQDEIDAFCIYQYAVNEMEIA